MSFNMQLFFFYNLPPLLIKRFSILLLGSICLNSGASNCIGSELDDQSSSFCTPKKNLTQLIIPSKKIQPLQTSPSPRKSPTQLNFPSPRQSPTQLNFPSPRKSPTAPLNFAFTKISSHRLGLEEADGLSPFMRTENVSSQDQSSSNKTIPPFQSKFLHQKKISPNTFTASENNSFSSDIIFLSKEKNKDSAE